MGFYASMNLIVEPLYMTIDVASLYLRFVIWGMLIITKDDSFLPHRKSLCAGDELEFERVLVSIEEGK
jgi:hypothetical protein